MCGSRSGAPSPRQPSRRIPNTGPWSPCRWCRVLFSPHPHARGCRGHLTPARSHQLGAGHGTGHEPAGGALWRGRGLWRRVPRLGGPAGQVRGCACVQLDAVRTRCAAPTQLLPLSRAQASRALAWAWPPSVAPRLRRSSSPTTSFQPLTRLSTRPPSIATAVATRWRWALRGVLSLTRARPVQRGRADHPRAVRCRGPRGAISLAERGGLLCAHARPEDRHPQRPL